MTLPDERYRAIAAAERFMRDLLDPRATPRVHSTIRDRARAVLRHYPNSLDLKQLSDAAPHVIQERMEPLHRMVLAHAQQQCDINDSEGGEID